MSGSVDQGTSARSLRAVEDNKLRRRRQPGLSDGRAGLSFTALRTKVGTGIRRPLHAEWQCSALGQKMRTAWKRGSEVWAGCLAEWLRRRCRSRLALIGPTWLSAKTAKCRSDAGMPSRCEAGACPRSRPSIGNRGNSGRSRSDRSGKSAWPDPMDARWGMPIARNS